MSIYCAHFNLFKEHTGLHRERTNWYWSIYPQKTSSKKQKNTVSPLKRNGKIKLTKHYSTIEAIQQHVSFHRDTEFREYFNIHRKEVVLSYLAKVVPLAKGYSFSQHQLFTPLAAKNYDGIPSIHIAIHHSHHHILCLRKYNLSNKLSIPQMNSSISAINYY